MVALVRVQGGIIVECASKPGDKADRDKGKGNGKPVEAAGKTAATMKAKPAVVGKRKVAARA